MANTEDHKTDESQVYELSYLILPSIPEDEVSKVVDSINKCVEKVGGEIFDSEAPHKRKLAYEMTKVVGASRYVVGEAYMGWIKFILEPSSTEALKTSIEEMNEILRYLLVKAERETTFTFASVMEPEEEEGTQIDTDDAQIDTDGDEVASDLDESESN